MITQRHFAPLFWTQALGVGNTAFLFGYLATPAAGEEGIAPGLLLGLLIAPLLLLSLWGGVLGDRLDKSRLIRRLKLLELGIALLAALLIWLASGPLLYLLPLLLGGQAALFGPVRYAILPQHLLPTEWVSGNAWISLGTFLALSLGLVLGAWVAGLPEWSRLTAVLVIIATALLGLVASLAIPFLPSREARIVPPRTPAPRLSVAGPSRPLLLAMLGLGIFWFLGTSYLLQLPGWAHGVVGGATTLFSLLLAVLTIGAALGALLCARFSAGRLELGLVVIGALLMGAGGLVLSTTPVLAGDDQSLAQRIAQYDLWKMLLALGMTGVGGGLFIVPLQTLIQLMTQEEGRARMIAINNILAALLMAMALLVGVVMSVWLGMGPQPFMGGLGLIALLVGVGLMIRNPRPVLRLLIFALVHLIYRLRFRGRQHIPARGAALVICNHVSFMDALVIGGASPRPLRFLMDRPIYESPWLNWWFRIVGAIPVDSERHDPGSVRRALDEVSRALRQGDVVMLFPEGRLTTDGEIHRFRRGLDIILARDPVPVVPAGLAGLWGSWTSHCSGRALTKFPRRFRARVALFFGEPLTPEQARRGVLEARVRELKAGADQCVARVRPGWGHAPDR
nr:1-acyl-sn-glycerol-3-phosphate acyltransferase [Halomonas populi]